MTNAAPNFQGPNDGGNDAALHRADIGEDRAGFEMRRRGARRVAHRADRHTENDEIGAGNSFCGALDNVANAQLTRALAHIGIGIEAGDLARKILPPCHMRDRGADKAQADQRNFVKEGRRACRTKPFRHAASPGRPRIRRAR